MDALSILGKHPADLLATKPGRIAATRTDPALFAMLYLPHHLKSPDGSITFATAHDDWASLMKGLWTKQRKPRAFRHALIAPRATGKSTWWFLIAPLWAAAHGYTSFITAFADTSTQAETHLATFRHELASNALLRNDFPLLTTPGPTDSRSMYIASNGLVFAARGADTSSLGLKVGATRPDLLILDDIEPGESNYSPYLAEKRLQTLIEVILPLNEFARVIAVGTVTMPNSIIHQLLNNEEPWIADENFTTHYHPGLITNPDGTQTSLWPEKWPIDYLQSISHTRAFLKNFQNKPISTDGEYWTPADIHYADLPDLTTTIPRTIISVDPAVTSKTTSDDTGIAVLSFIDGRIHLRHATGIKAGGRGLRDHIARLHTTYPDARVLLVESNQGGALWKEVFAGLPLKIRTTHSTDPKHVRAAELLEHYQTGRIVHTTGIQDSKLLDQLLNFPNTHHDDVLDAVALGARYLAPLAKPKLTFSVA